MSVDPGIFDYATIRLACKTANFDTGTGCFGVIPVMSLSAREVDIRIRNRFPGILSIFL